MVIWSTFLEVPDPVINKEEQWKFLNKRFMHRLCSIIIKGSVAVQTGFYDHKQEKWFNTNLDEINNVLWWSELTDPESQQ